MHNCKAIRSRLIEQALDETLSGAGLPADFEGCSACREEFASLRSVLRATDQAMQTTQPREDFWPDYHMRLSQSLKSGSTAATPVRSGHLHLQPGFTSWMRKLVTASVPVPVPLAAVLVVLVAGSLLFAMNSRRSSGPESLPGSPSVATKILELPVIQERTVTRVVYRERNSGASRGRSLSPARSAASAAVARRSSPEPLISLVGFKPANEVKLTIIKGSDRDEK